MKANCIKEKNQLDEKLSKSCDKKLSDLEQLLKKRHD